MNAELVDIVEKLRISKATYKELKNLYDTIITKDSFDKKEAEIISDRMQMHFDENIQFQMLFKEKEAVLKELQNLLEENKQ